MSTADILEILLSHDQWATEQILDACATLTDEQFHQSFPIGPGSLHDTITHMLGAMQTWTQTLSGKQLGSRVDQDGKKRTLAELQALAKSCYREFALEAHQRPLDEMVSRQRAGKTFQYSRAVVVAHVATHGMHHRAQCLNMLRHLDVKPLPPSSVAEWSRMAAEPPGN